MITILEITKWTGITVFEMLMHAIALFLATILLVLKSHSVVSISFWIVFTPLFIASALNCYFLFIIFVRTVVEEHQLRRAFVSNAFNFLRAVMVSMFEILLCYKVEGDFERSPVAVESTYGVVFLPVWILMTALGFQACRLL